MIFEQNGWTIDTRLIHHTLLNQTILADRSFQQAFQNMRAKLSFFCAFHDPSGKCVKDTGELEFLWKP